jgi:hypothetical protein
MSKHTAGPWSISENRAIWHDDYMIGAVCSSIDGRDKKTADANAKLIAAAPELYALAKSVVDWYENAGNADPDQDSQGSAQLWSKARAVLAKVR